MPGEILDNRAPFVIGDWVVYNPDSPNLLPIRERRNDIGRIVDIRGKYYIVDFVFRRFKREDRILIDPMYSDGVLYYALTALPADIREEIDPTNNDFE